MTFDDVVTNVYTDVSAHVTYLNFLGCRHKYIGSDKGCQGVPIAQVVAVGGEPA